MKNFLIAALAIVIVSCLGFSTLAVPDYTHTTGKPELIDKRTINSKQYLNSDGSITAEIYQIPVHYWKENKWHDIDTRFEQQSGPDYDFAMTKNAYNLFFSKNSARPQKFTIGDSWISFQPISSKTVEGQVNNNQITYADLWPNTDLRYFSTNSGLKEEVILKNQTTAVSFSFKINLQGFTYEKRDEGIVLKNKTGQVQAMIPQAFMEDASGASSDNVAMNLEEKGTQLFLTLVPDKTWLNAADRVYPVIVDPTVTLENVVTQDTYVTRYGTGSVHGSDTKLEVGMNHPLFSNWVDSHALVQFNLSAIPSDATVSAATMKLYLYKEVGDSPVDISVNRITSAWKEGSVSWNSKPTYAPAISDTKTVDGTGYYNFKLDPFWISDWNTGKAYNYGVYLSCPSNQVSNLKYFYSKEDMYSQCTPVLIVTYEGGTGVESYWPYKSFNLGSAGSAMVNIFSGNLVYQSTDISIPARGFNLAFSRTYNSLRNKDDGFGWGWKVEGSSTVQITNSGDVYLVQSDGSEHLFKNLGDNAYSAPEGLNVKLFVSPDPVSSGYDYKFKNADRVTLTYFVPTGSSNGLLQSKTDKFGNNITYWYDSNNRLSRMDDSSDKPRSINLSYDANGRLAYISDPLNRTASYHYDSMGNLTSYTDFGGHITTYTYYLNSHRLESVIEAPANEITPGNKTVFVYDGNRIKSVTGANQSSKEPSTQLSTRFTIANATTGYGFTAQVYEPLSDATIRNTTYLLGVDGTLSESDRTDSLSGTTTYTFGYEKRRIKNVSDGKSVTQLTYNCDNPDGIPDVIEEIKDYEATDLNHHFNYKTVYTYDTYHNVCTVTDPKNGFTQNIWSSDGTTLTSVTDATNHTTSYTYNKYGQVETTTVNKDGVDIVVTNQYDEYGNLHIVTRPLNQTEVAKTQYDYDVLGNLTTRTDPQGVVTNYYYTDCNQLKNVSNPKFPTDPTKWNTYKYYGNHNLHTVEYLNQAGLATVTYEYTELNNLHKVIYPDGTYDQYDYDIVGNMTHYWDKDGKGIGYFYDSKGQLTFVQDSTGLSYDIKYNEFGLRKSVTDQDGSTRSYVYNDNLNRLTEVTEQFKGINTIYVTKYSYDAVNNVKTMNTCFREPGTNVESNVKATTYDYTPVYQLWKVTDPFSGKTTVYDYDTVNNVKSVTYPDLTSENYTYDYANRLETITFGGVLTDASYKYTYYLDDNVKTLEKKSNADSYTVTYNYDKLGELTDVIQVAPNGIVKKVQKYDYDLAGNRILFTENGIEKTYTYDLTNKLTQMTRNAFGQTTITPFTYDNRGNMITKGGTSYHFNGLDRLDTVGKGDMRYYFSYDGDGRRVRQQIYDTRANTSSTIYYHLDENWNTLYETDSSNYVARSFINGLKTIGIQKGGVVSYNYQDNLGSTIGIESGSTVQTYNYDAFGADEVVVDDFSYTDSLTNHGWSTFSTPGSLTLVDDATLKTKVLRVQSSYGTGYTIQRGNDTTNALNIKRPALSAKYQAKSPLDMSVRVMSKANQMYTLTYHIGVNGVNNLQSNVYHVYVGAALADGSWKLLERDLSKDLKDGTSASFDRVLSIAVAGGDFYLDDIMLGGQDLTGNTRKYTDMDQDSVGLYYMRNRYYDPEIGRFISDDTYRGDLFNPLSLNRYIYTENNPLKYVDPSGNSNEHPDYGGDSDVVSSTYESVTFRILNTDDLLAMKALLEPANLSNLDTAGEMALTYLITDSFLLGFTTGLLNRICAYSGGQDLSKYLDNASSAGYDTVTFSKKSTLIKDGNTYTQVTESTVSVMTHDMCYHGNTSTLTTVGTTSATGRVSYSTKYSQW